jgi:hypothetical protein
MAAVDVFMEGTKAVVRAEFRVPDDDGVLTDPAAVTFTARHRLSGVLQTPTAYVYGVAPEVTRVSTGIYELTFVPTEGTWYVHVQGTGPAHAAGEATFVIEHAEALT